MAKHGEKTTEETAKTKKSGGVAVPRIAIVIGVVVVALAAIVLLNGSRGGGNNTYADYAPTSNAYSAPATQCRPVPYQDTEAYQDQECQTVPYTDRECEAKQLTFSKTDYTCSRGGLIGDWTVAQCTINNLDSEGGTFSVNIGVTVDGNNVGEQQSHYLYSQGSYTFKYSVQANAPSCYCNERVIPTKQVCRDVIKTRQDCNTVTKYRPVTRYREECN